ncbi:DUF3459 domain-containing protein, partial [Saccharomonospora iraqiensis]|uniref:DUF3459 domain-containing protein n=1 Tax=Saccharomonospora iraqiensis TaxID=52698 RepID=UPI00047A8D66
DATGCDARADVLAFTRGDGFVCTVNFGDAPVTLPRPGEPLLASHPGGFGDGGDPDTAGRENGDGVVTLPPNSAVWWSGDTHG